MSAPTQSASPINLDDIAMGAKVISYAAQALGFMASMAIASACSSVVMSVIVGAISTVVLMLLASAAAFIGTNMMSTAHVAAVGATTNSVIFKLGGWIARAKNVVAKPANPIGNSVAEAVPA